MYGYGQSVCRRLTEVAWQVLWFWGMLRESPAPLALMDPAC